MVTTPDDRRKNYRDSQDFYSSKLSDTTRSMAFGLAAVAFTLLSTDTAFAKRIASTSPMLLIIVAGLASLSIVADSVQMLLGWFGSKRAAENEQGKYTADEVAKNLFFWREVMFYLKIVVAFAGAGILMLLLAGQIISPAPWPATP